MDTTPFISIIVPVYNGAETIDDCIASLINQNYTRDKYEVIVVDNDSTDNTAEVIRRYPVRYEEEKTIKSAYAARNKGIMRAKGEILAFIDSDCAAARDWLKKGIEGFSNAEIGCAGGGIRAQAPQNHIEEYLSDRNIISQEEKSPDLPLPYAKTANAFYRKEVFDRIGFFGEGWLSAGDADLSWRMQLETGYKIRFIPEAAVFHKHRSSILSMYKQCLKWGVGYAHLYKKYKNLMPKRTSKQAIWIFWRLFYVCGKIAILSFCKKEGMSKETRKEYLDHISFMGWEIGRIIGSLKYGVFAV